MRVHTAESCRGVGGLGGGALPSSTTAASRAVTTAATSVTAGVTDGERPPGSAAVAEGGPYSSPVQTWPSGGSLLPRLQRQGRCVTVPTVTVAGAVAGLELGVALASRLELCEPHTFQTRAACIPCTVYLTTERRKS